MKGSRITPPRKAAVKDEVAEDRDRLAGGMMIAALVLAVGFGDIECALGVVTAIDRNTLLAEEEDELGVGKVFVAARRYGILLMPGEEVPVAMSARHEIVEV